jgi:lysozyme family protein
MDDANVEPSGSRPDRRFELCLSSILRDRNGYAPGWDGPTNHGISQDLYKLWRESNLLEPREVWGIEFREVELIYRSHFWEPSHAWECPPPLDLLVFECAAESGPRWAIQTLQQALGLRRDGLFGPRMRDRIRSCDERSVALDFLLFRQNFYADLADRHPDCQEIFSIRIDRVERQKAILQRTLG